MKSKLNKYQIERFSRQIILKKIGILGQKKIVNSKVLIVGMGGLGCPAAEFLARAGVGLLGIIDYDKVDLSNLHRQSLYSNKDLNRFKVNVVKSKLNQINPDTKIIPYRIKANKNNFEKILKNYDFIIDGSDNFKTKFLINDICNKFKKCLITAAISKFEGHVLTFSNKNKKDPCLRCFFQEDEISDDILNCEYDGVLGSVAGVVGAIQANEVLKLILNIGKSLNGFILIIDLLNLNFRKVRIKRRKPCLCN